MLYNERGCVLYVTLPNATESHRVGLIDSITPFSSVENDVLLSIKQIWYPEGPQFHHVEIVTSFFDDDGWQLYANTRDNKRLLFSLLFPELMKEEAVSFQQWQSWKKSNKKIVESADKAILKELKQWNT